MIVAGFGFRKAASVASLQDALMRASAGRTVALLATAQDKADAVCFSGLAAALGVPVVAVPQSVLATADTLTKTAAVRTLRGSGSVAEAAALVAAGPGASLLGARAVSADRMATCALATRTFP